MEEVASNSQLHCSKNMGGRGADAITGNQGLGHCESRGNSITLRTGLRVARVALCVHLDQFTRFHSNRDDPLDTSLSKRARISRKRVDFIVTP